MAGWRDSWALRGPLLGVLLACAWAGYAVLALRDVLLVRWGVGCEVYESGLNRGLRSALEAAALATVGLLLAHAARALLLRRPKRLWIDLAALALGALVAWINFDQTFLHCLFYGVELPPCAFGCPH